MNKADKYSGLVTATAVLFAVIYSGDKYDVWDAYLGFLGVILGMLYMANAKDNDFFSRLLISTLISISIVAIVFLALPTVTIEEEQFLNLWGFNIGDFLVFIGFLVVFMCLMSGFPRSISNKAFQLTQSLTRLLS